MPGMSGTHRFGSYSLTIGADGKILVKRGDWLSKYSAALHQGNTSYVREYGRLKAGKIVPIKNVDLIIAGETIYHIPTYQATHSFVADAVQIPIAVAGPGGGFALSTPAPAPNGEPDDAKRRTALRDFAKQLNTEQNKCLRLVYIIAKAAELVDGLPNPDRLMIDDLEKVLIGEGLTRRGTGPYWAGFNRGAAGFKADLQDRSDQSAHAMAGVIIGYRHWGLVEGLVKWQEPEAQDDRLYDATFPLGDSLNAGNYKGLAERVGKAIGEVDCRP